MPIHPVERLRVVAGDLLPNPQRQLIRAHKAMDADEAMAELSRIYERRVGVPPNLEHPVTYNEKLQWRKLYQNDPRFSTLTDKVAVRPFVERRVGAEHLIPLLGVWDEASQIDFNALPDSFVLKTNNASGTNILVPDKAAIDEWVVRHRLDQWLSTEFGWVVFEPHYLRIPPRILAEEYLRDDAGRDSLLDYKFLCFDGSPQFVWVDFDRSTDHRRNIYDTRWRLQPWSLQYPTKGDVLPRPDTLDEMLDVAARLSEGFDYVRVDLYSVGGRVVFGEMTFTSEAGLGAIDPPRYDELLGSCWHLDTSTVVDPLYG